MQKNYKVYIPNAISPNGDRKNDFFEIFPGTSTLRVKSLEIFTRWGEAAFAFDVVTEIRNTRNAKGLSPKEALKLLVKKNEQTT